MTHGARRKSEGDIYHVIARGNGQQIIFEDDSDRKFFLDTLNTLSEENEAELIAWCLMSNHVHLLIHAPIEVVSSIMHRLQTGYALYYNKKHERHGSLFQGRFGSIPIETNEQLMAAVMYIHNNPVKAGDAIDCPWSSYNIFAKESPVGKYQKLVCELFGNPQRFADAHKTCPDANSYAVPKTRYSEREALLVARETVSPYDVYDIRTLNKKERNEQIRKMKEAGLSIRQICRLTSIGYGIVARV